MKYLPIFNKGDKVTVNNKYLGLKSMVGEIYTIRAGPAVCSDTWCYWLENVAGGIAADALEPLDQTKEEWLHTLNTEQLAEHLLNVWMDGAFNVNAEFGLDEAQIEQHKGYIVEWLKQPHRKENEK